MYTNLPAENFRTGQDERAARTIHLEDVQDTGAVAAPRNRRMRRRIATAIATLGVCVAASAAVAISDASAHPQSTTTSRHASAAQFQREMRALETVGFVATSCRVDGMMMTNYSTNQSVLLTW